METETGRSVKLSTKNVYMERSAWRNYEVEPVTSGLRQFCWGRSSAGDDHLHICFASGGRFGHIDAWRWDGRRESCPVSGIWRRIIGACRREPWNGARRLRRGPILYEALYCLLRRSKAGVLYRISRYACEYICTCICTYTCRYSPEVHSSYLTYKRRVGPTRRGLRQRVLLRWRIRISYSEFCFNLERMNLVCVELFLIEVSVVFLRQICLTSLSSRLYESPTKLTALLPTYCKRIWLTVLDLEHRGTAHEHLEETNRIVSSALRHMSKHLQQST